MYKEAFLNLLIKFLRLFYQATKNRSISIVMEMMCVSLKSLFFKATKNKVVFSYGLLCFMLFNLSEAQTQSRNHLGAAERQTEIKPLEIGDTIPEQLWNLPLKVVNHPAGEDTITLNYYRDKKLIILDFWATWCVPCVKSLTQLDSASNVFGDDLAILASTYEEASVASQFLEKRNLKLTSANARSNELLKSFFPHRMVPHQVWITDGMVKAITGHPKNIVADIAAVLSGEAVDMEDKVDMIDYDYRQPIIPFTLRADELIVSHTTSGQLKGVGTMASSLMMDNRHWITFSNYPLMRIYTQALGLPANRIIVDSARPELFVSNSGKNPNSIVCYQLIAPGHYTEKQINDYIVRSLNLDLNLCGKWDTIEMDCWVIRNPSEMSNNHNVAQQEKQMVRLTDLLERYNKKIASTASPIYVNETTGKVLVKDDFSLRDLNDPKKMQHKLFPYGLHITAEKMKIPVYRIQDMTDIQSRNQQK